MNQLLRILLVTAAFGLTSCSLISPSVKITVPFSDTGELQKGAEVQFEGNAIGEVNSIKAVESGSEVVLHLQPEAAKAVHADAAALITGSPPLVTLYNSVAEAEPIADGASLRGLNSQLELAAWKLETGATDFGAFLEQVTTSVKDYLESDEWNNTKKQWRESLADLGKQSQESVEQTTQNLDSIMKQLESESADAMAEAKKHFQSLQDQWSEFQEQGQYDLSETLGKILEQLKMVMEEKQDNSV